MLFCGFDISPNATPTGYKRCKRVGIAWLTHLSSGIRVNSRHECCKEPEEFAHRALLKVFAEGQVSPSLGEISIPFAISVRIQVLPTHPETPSIMTGTTAQVNDDCKDHETKQNGNLRGTHPELLVSWILSLTVT